MWKGKLYLLAPTSSSLQTASKKLRLDWIGPLVLQEKIDPTHFILSDLEGKILKSTFHINRIKAGFIRDSGEPISNIAKLRERVLKTNKDSATTPFKILNEDGIEVNNMKEGLFLISETHQTVDLEQHAKYSIDNEGMAAPEKLSNKQIERMAKATFKQPKSGTDYDISKGRFKDGHLELLLKHPENPQSSFWLNAYYHPCLMSVIEQIADKTIKLKITGSPMKLMKKRWF